MDFGAKLKHLRLQAGWTQKQLGEKLGVTKSVVSFYELQERSPSPEILIKMSRVFNVSADYLLGIDKTSVIDISGLDDNDVKVVKLMIETLRAKNRHS